MYCGTFILNVLIFLLNTGSKLIRTDYNFEKSPYFIFFLTEKQREEKRLQKLREKEQYRAPVETDTWADRLSTYQAKGLPDQGTGPTVSDTNTDAQRISSAPMPPVQEPQQISATSSTPQPKYSYFCLKYLKDKEVQCFFFFFQPNLVDPNWVSVLGGKEG